MNSVGAIVIMYYPDDEFCKRMNSTLNEVDIMVLVNNGCSNDSRLRIAEFVTSNNGKVILHDMNDNVGVASALNSGCEKLLSFGCNMALLLDQDSIVTAGMVDSLLNIYEIRHDCAVAGPQILPRHVSLKVIAHSLKYMLVGDGLLFRRSLVKDYPLKVAFNITSGSLIKLDVWKEVGGFWDKLFIEGVDSEYGLRINSKGYSVYIDPNSYLYQEYGSQREVRLWGVNFFPTFHSPLRSYYISRNRIFIWTKHGLKHPYYIVWDVLSAMKRFLLILAFEDLKVRKIFMSIRGYLHGIFGFGGRYRK